MICLVGTNSSASRIWKTLSAAGWCALAIASTGVLRAEAALRFVERSVDWGLDFRHHHGGSGERFMVETMVGGVLAFDYDGDGDDDVLWIDGAALPGYDPEPSAGAPRSILHRNDGGRFVDVTASAGIAFAGYGCGGAVADIDDDGDLDVLVTAFGDNALFVNQGDGTFREETTQRGLQDPLWNSSAAFADADLDGDLDLYVGSYVDFNLSNHKACGKPDQGLVGYCHPDSYQGERDRFYLNDGLGVFREVGESAGLGAAREASLGVIFADVDGDMLPDIYVANDLDPNQLFRNLGGAKFEDVSLLSGTGYSLAGRAEAGMGVEFADLDLDGRGDLVVTNFALESNAYYRNQGLGLFIDSRYPARLAEASLQSLGFGLVAADFDHDGDQDLLIANGHILDNAEQLSAVRTYAQPNQLMRNLGGTFEEAKGIGLDVVRVSRGLAVSDLDLDGDLDALVVNSNQLSEVYENVGAATDLFLGLAMRATVGNATAIGARVKLSGAAARPQVRVLKTGGSYLSQSSLTLHFGMPLGAQSETAATLDIHWPQNPHAVLRLEKVPHGRRLLVIQP